MSTASFDEETAKKVIRQVDFYFSDSNLPRDKFLRNTITESEDGMVSLALICSFQRMRNHLSLGDAKLEDISDDTVKAVAETLRTSSFLKLSEDGKKVGRATALLKPEEIIEQLDAKTIAASPLEYDVKLEDVESFFGQFAKVNSVRLPPHVVNKRLFCGTALIEFSTEEDATNILEKSLVYAGVELQLKLKKEFNAERAKQSEEADSNRKNNSNVEQKNVEPNYPQGLIIAFKLKSISAGVSTEQNGSDVNPDVHKTDEEPESTGNVTKEAEHKVAEDDKNDEENDKENMEESREKADEKTCLETEVQEADEKTCLETEVQEADDGQKPLDSTIQKDEQASREEKCTTAVYKDSKDVVSREDLKSVFQKFGTVKFIDFQIGLDSGYIRFEEAGAAQKARAAAALTEEGGLIVKNFIATLDPVTGELEKEYWNLLRNVKGRFWENKGHNYRGRGGRHNRGGRHFNGKHHRSRENDSAGRPNKFQKVGAA